MATVVAAPAATVRVVPASATVVAAADSPRFTSATCRGRPPGRVSTPGRTCGGVRALVRAEISRSARLACCALRNSAVANADGLPY
eukprot:7170181-Prymnesium_polylepis.1